MAPGIHPTFRTHFRCFGIVCILLALAAAPSTLAQVPAPSPSDLPSLETSEPAADSILEDPAVLAGSELRLVANVPGSRLDVFVDGRLAKSYRVTVGSPWNKTPLGEQKISRVIWNPWWHPPANRRPQEKTASPGPSNPMGRVKMQFGLMYYVHGTVKLSEIGRAASRGCIRMENADAIELARLVHHFAGPDLEAADLDALAANTKKTRKIELPRPVALDIVYRLAEVRDDALHVYEDVYRRTKADGRDAAVAALGEAGLAIDDVDADAFATIGSASLPVTIPLSALLRPQPATETAVASLPIPVSDHLDGSPPQSGLAP